MNKPLVFNYRRYEELQTAYKELLEENQSIKHRLENLEIRCRILETDNNELRVKLAAQASATAAEKKSATA